MLNFSNDRVWQAKDGLPDEMLSGPLGHTGGLPCRRHAKRSMRHRKSSRQWVG